MTDWWTYGLVYEYVPLRHTLSQQCSANDGLMMDSVIVTYCSVAVIQGYP